MSYARITEINDQVRKLHEQASELYREEISGLKAQLWTTTTLLAIATGDQSYAKDKTIQGMSAEEWAERLPRLREQFGVGGAE